MKTAPIRIGLGTLVVFLTFLSGIWLGARYGATRTSLEYAQQNLIVADALRTHSEDAKVFSTLEGRVYPSLGLANRYRAFVMFGEVKDLVQWFSVYVPDYIRRHPENHLRLSARPVPPADANAVMPGISRMIDRHLELERSGMAIIKD